MIDNDDFDKRLDSGLKKMARHPVPSKEFCSAVMEKIRGKHLRWHQRLRQFMFRSHTFEWNFASSFASLFLLVMVFFGYESTNVQNNLPTSGASNLVNVRFMYESDMAKQIALSGNFNQWQPTYSLQQNAAGLWFIDVPLKPGRYEYQFVIDGERRLADPKASQYLDDGFGGRNSILIVAEQGENRNAI